MLRKPFKPTRLAGLPGYAFVRQGEVGPCPDLSSLGPVTDDVAGQDAEHAAGDDQQICDLHDARRFHQATIFTLPTPASTKPITRAAGYPASLIVLTIAAARCCAHAMSRPPEVCGSVNR